MRPTYLAILLSAVSLNAEIEIRIDYSLDTNGFFTAQERRDAIEAVAAFYGDMINDTLLRIDPADFTSASWTGRVRHPETGSIISIDGLVIPENVIIVYVGARSLSGSTAGRGGPNGFSASGFTSWFERIRGRGSPGAAESEPGDRTDFAPWGGAIAFDDRTWNFSLSGNGPGSEFVAVALHEMGHVLGIGTADTWDNQLDSGSGTFTGAAVANSLGSAPSADSGHFLGSLTSPRFESFGNSHGTSRPVMMLPTFTDDGVTLEVATDLDLSGLVDIGWELDPPDTFDATALSPSNAAFEWNSVSFKNYVVERSTDLSSFPGGSSPFAGDGTAQNWTDPSPPSNQGFYRLAVTDAIAGGGGGAASFAEGDPVIDTFRSIYEPPKEVENCELPEEECDHSH